MNKIALISLSLTLALVAGLAACGASLVPVPLPELDEVIDALGYGLAPTSLPEGFEFYRYDVLGKPDDFDMMPPGGPFAIVLYQRYKDYAYHYVVIQYPWSFPPSVSDDFLLESLGLEWQRPDDAVSEVKVNGKPAYLVRGTWSTDTLEQLQKADPELLAEYTPEWDYEGLYLSLYFDFDISEDETIGVMIQAMLYPSEWITATELVKIAESLRRLD